MSRLDVDVRLKKFNKTSLVIFMRHIALQKPSKELYLEILNSLPTECHLLVNKTIQIQVLQSLNVTEFSIVLLLLKVWRPLWWTDPDLVMFKTSSFNSMSEHLRTFRNQNSLLRHFCQNSDDMRHDQLSSIKTTSKIAKYNAYDLRPHEY